MDYVEHQMINGETVRFPMPQSLPLPTADIIDARAESDILYFESPTIERMSNEYRRLNTEIIE